MFDTSLEDRTLASEDSEGVLDWKDLSIIYVVAFGDWVVSI